MNKSETQSFELNLNVKSAVPIFEQVRNAVKTAIFLKKLNEGQQLPSIRDLALKHKINPMTALKAYSLLEIEGFLYSRRGSGFFVHVNREKIKKEKQGIFEKEVEEFIEKINGLGYSVSDLKAELQKRLKGK
ncbi:MAG: GntR family transcriptional regulator [Thermodesulfovibrionales bacterium]|nr:GntR family transcriptional regulator [Thermodesulfovibrionales bacterium]